MVVLQKYQVTVSAKNTKEGNGFHIFTPYAFQVHLNSRDQILNWYLCSAIY